MALRKNERWAMIGLAAISLAIHFAWFGTPNTTVFDEVHFGKFLSSYFTHEYYFDIHPPLGKLILAAWGKLWGFQAGFSFANIGDAFPDNMYIALRFLPSLAGALLPLAIYGIARQLKISRWASLLAGLLVALDNALLVQSRLILLDSFLLLFGFGALWCYFRWRQGGHPYLLATTGILGGMAMSIKWTGISFLALIVILEAIHLWRERHAISFKTFGPIIASFAVIPFLIYYSAFMAHFSLLNKTGTGDAFMTPSFQRDLEGSTYASDPTLQSLSPWQKFIELNTQMYDSNKRLTATHPYGSKWYTWPFMDRPIYYWIEGQARIYLLGNPIVWWGSTIGVIAMIVTALFSGLRRINPVVAILVGAWLMNMLPFVGISRVMFLYHYFIALIWAILMLVYLVDQAKNPKRITWMISGLALIAFIFFAPLSYGLPLSERGYDIRTWFSTWR